jgi:hypothetical protein
MNIYKYIKRLYYMMKISVKLSLSSTAFFFHALFPPFKIPHELDMDSMALYLFEKNNELED